MSPPAAFHALALADVIRSRLLGVAADDQDVTLEDGDWRLIIERLEATPVRLAGSFEEAWALTGRQYGPDALENVMLGWDLATQAELGSMRVVAAARAVLAVRPENWNDGEDPEAQNAWRSLELALNTLGKDPPEPAPKPGLARDIEAAQGALEQAQDAYLRRWGWILTCNTPGSFWLWERDFAAEDMARHAAWAAGGPGPSGRMPSEPRPIGRITADRELAVSMTLRSLDERPEDQDGDDD